MTVERIAGLLYQIALVLLSVPNKLQLNADCPLEHYTK